MCSSAPDTSGLNRAAEQSAALGKEQLDWYKQIYAETAPDRAAASARAAEVSDAQLTQMKQQTDLAKEYSDYNKTTFRPLEKSLVAEATNYDTEDRRNAEAGKAMADVTQAFNNTEQQTRRGLSRLGVDPSSGRALAIGDSMGLAKASALAGAAGKARNLVETTGFARKMDAAGLGRGLSGNASTAASLALNAGNNAVGSSMVPLQVAGQGAGLMQQGFSGAMAGNNSAGQMYGQVASIENTANANNNAIWSAAGSGLGSYFGRK